MSEHVFVDAGIAMDMLLERQPHCTYAVGLFSMAERGELKLFTSAVVVCNLYYLLARNLGKLQARKIIGQFRTMVGILPVDERGLDFALVSDFSDFEDAIQYYTAKQHGIKTLITRNLKDYKSASIRIISAQTFLNS